MARSPEDAYLHWLAPLVIRRGAGTYWDLLQIMQQTEFIWLPEAAHDDNRMMDGLDLRVEFLEVYNTPQIRDPGELGPVSVLEVLVGLSRRLAFMADGRPKDWAWNLLCNLGFERYSDDLTKYKRRRAEDILDALVWRRYNPDGSGGFFPLQNPDEDQTRVELWYQMSAYVEEIHPEY